MNNRRSKTSLFLMEFIITLLLFAVCSAVCIRFFAAADSLSRKTKELGKAVAVAQSCAEIMRGTDGSIDSILEMYPEAVYSGGNYFEVFYDDDFNECEYSGAAYVSDVSLSPNGAIQNMDIRIVRLSDYEEIYSLTATKYMNKVKG